MTSERLSLRALNRATLERQLLLRRAAMAAREAVGHLAGLQAQAPLAPYVGLWTRLAGFGHQELKDLLTERAVVRAHLMRNTVHLVTAPDFVAFRPLFQPLHGRALAGHFGPNLVGVDLGELREVSAALLTARPLTRAELSRELAVRWPATTRGAGLRRHPPAAPGPGAPSRPVGPAATPPGLWPPRGWTAWAYPRRIRPGRGSSWCCGTWPPTGRPA